MSLCDRTKDFSYTCSALYRPTKSKYNSAMNINKHTHERGEISGMQITIAGLVILVLGLGSFAIWSFVNYNDAKDNVDNKISVAVLEAKKEEGDVQEAKFAERDKQPLKRFKGPENYCGLQFSYPKTWSAFVNKDATNGGDFEAYLSPDTVPPLGTDQQFGLRVLIEQDDYDKIVSSYDGLVKKGDLKQSTTSSEGNQGVRLTGNFSKNIRGDAVVFKCRAYTITIRTDSNAFNNDYENIIKTISFNT